MTNTVISPAARAKQWDNKFWMEYVRDSRFKRYMGSDENSIIQVNRDLTKKKGDAITFNLVGALDATTPNDGSTALVGNEKQLPNEGFQVTVKVVRDAVVVNGLEEQASAFDVREAGRVALKDLSMRLIKLAIIKALSNVATGVPYATGNATQRNAWNANNVDRVLYGTSVANYNATASTALNAVTGTMRMSKEIVSLAKRIAQGAVTVNGDGIRPFKYGEDEETYVMFVGKLAYRDLKEDLADVHENARERSKENPLFTGTTSLYWDGVVIREIPEIAGFNNTAGTVVRVEPWYLCGSQAVAVAWAQTTKTTLRKEDDYGYQNGVGFMEIRGIEKVVWDQDGTPKDWGMVTGFVAAPLDA